MISSSTKDEHNRIMLHGIQSRHSCMTGIYHVIYDKSCLTFGNTIVTSHTEEQLWQLLARMFFLPVIETVMFHTFKTVSILQSRKGAESATQTIGICSVTITRRRHSHKNILILIVHGVDSLSQGFSSNIYH